MTFYQKLEALLKTKPEHLGQDGGLLKTQIIHGVHTDNPALIELLLSDSTVKAEYFKEIGGALVFLKDKFLTALEDKNFLANSYTAYKNKIGLMDNEGLLKYRGEVVLNFPFKDCVLEGGQTSEDTKKNEIFFNETLAKDEIDRLLAPKAFCNIKKITAKGEPPLKAFSRLQKHGDITDNLLIKGNNLLALHSLKKAFAGKVKLIYIDPPYNTGNDGFKYNDNFNHSSWLVFMKNRLEIARELLREDGVLFVQCDDNEQAYLKVLLDEIFGRENFVNTIIWQKKFSPQNDARWFSDNHDFILVHAKNKDSWMINLLPRTEEANARYNNPDNDPRGVWTSDNLSVKTYSKNTDYPIITPNGRTVNPPQGSCWRVNKEKFQEMLADNRIWFGEDGSNVPRIKRFLSEVKDGMTSQTVWLYQEVGHTQDAKREIIALTDKGDMPFTTPKGERLMERIITLATKPGDLVLDFFAGSGTTAAVAHKMGRQWITIEQMDYIEGVTKARLKKVLDGEQGGVSKTQSWQGGGEFVYLELAPFNEVYKQKILKANNTQALLDIYALMKEKAFLDYRLGLAGLDKDFTDLPFDEQRRILADMLDKNQMYIPYSEREDADYKLSQNDIQLSQDFYEPQLGNE